MKPGIPAQEAMTVNERLAISGLFPAFDAAVKQRDRAAIIAVLLKAGLSEAQAIETTDAILMNPKRYGF